VVDSQTTNALRESLGRLKESAEWAKIVEPQHRVIGRYQRLFSRDHIPSLTESEFREFLDFKNNCHWTGLERHPAIYADMDSLRKALMQVTDTTIPIAERFDFACRTVAELGPGTLTPILLVCFPEQFGVWNNVSRGAMKRLGLWPRKRAGEKDGQLYARANAEMVVVAAALGIDLWTLDALWWRWQREQVQ
jgi:hypothetical protein